MSLVMLWLLLAACAGTPDAQPSDDSGKSSANLYYSADISVRDIHESLPRFPRVYEQRVQPNILSFYVTDVDGCLSMSPRGYPTDFVDISVLVIFARVDIWKRIRQVGGAADARSVEAFCHDGASQDLIEWLAAKDDLEHARIRMESYQGVSLAPLGRLKGPLTLELIPDYNATERLLPAALLKSLASLDNVTRVELGGTMDQQGYRALVDLLNSRRLRYIGFEQPVQAVSDPSLAIAALTNASVAKLPLTRECIDAILDQMSPNDSFPVNGLHLEVSIPAREAALELASRCPRLNNLTIKIVGIDREH